MERRYLVATLALVATFAIFSREFCPGVLAKIPRSRAEVMADLACVQHRVAEQLMAKLQPFVDRSAPEQAQMMADLNLPALAGVQEKVAEAQAKVAEKVAEKQCEAALRVQREALRAQRANQRALEMRIRTGDLGPQINALTVIPAQEWSNLASLQAQKIDAEVLIRSQEITARTMQKVQCALEKSRAKLARSQAAGLPIHLDFVVPPTPSITVNVPGVPEPPSTPIF